MIYDYLIIGTGIAGLNAARMIPKDKKVLVVCKKTPWECNTFWAQGGVVRAKNEEDIPAHIKDTLSAGVFLNDEKAVETLSRNSMEAIDNLMKDRTALVIAHRLSTITDSDNIIVMSEGEIVEQGNHQELLALRGKYSKMWELQQSVNSEDN